MQSTSFKIISGSKVPATTSPAAAGRNRLDWISERARRVFASYRRDDYTDPETFLRNLAEALERYDDKTIEQACNPASADSIPRICKFPPNISEIAQVCDEIRRRNIYVSQWDARSKRQLEERDNLERQDKEGTLEHRTAVVNRVVDDLRERGFKFKSLGSVAARVISGSSAA